MSTEQALADSRTVTVAALWQMACSGRQTHLTPTSQESEEFVDNVQRAQKQAQDEKVFEAMKIIIDHGKEDITTAVSECIAGAPREQQERTWK